MLLLAVLIKCIFFFLNQVLGGKRAIENYLQVRLAISCISKLDFFFSLELAVEWEFRYCHNTPLKHLDAGFLNSSVLIAIFCVV